MVETYSVTITDEAWDDVYDIVAYLRRNVSETTAQNVRVGIINETRKLEKLPTGRPIVHEMSSDEEVYRFALKWKYKIIFFVNEEDKTVEVIAVTHSSQHPDRLKDLV